MMKAPLLLLLLLPALPGAAQTTLLDSVGDGISASIDDAAEQTVTRTVTDQVEQAVTRNVEDQVNQTVDQAVESQVGNAVEAQVDNAVTSAVEQSVTGAASRQVEDTVRGTVESTIGATITGGIERGSGDDVGRAARSLRDDVAATGSPRTLQDPMPVNDSAGNTLFVEVSVENGWRAVQQEWLATVDDAGLTALASVGADIVERKHYAGLGLTLVRFRVSAELDNYLALRALLPAAAESLDRNHVYGYRPQSSASANPGRTGSAASSAPVCEREVAIGIVDTAVNAAHPALAGANIEQRHFVGDAIDAPTDHGSSVAGLLVARSDDLSGMVPAARLSVAAVMYQRMDGYPGTTALHLLDALNWLAGREVQVVNLSLAGPPNQLLESAVAALVANGVTVVAAVGNEGPTGPALFPAAYDGVIGVTAVDDRKRIYRWANRGPQVDFAAPGVDVLTVDASGGIRTDSGTSMAAPVITAIAACRQQQSDAVAELAGRAEDLGEPGRDEVFGLGLVEPGLMETGLVQ